MSETSWGRRKYRTTNWKAYNAALKARGDLTIKCLFGLLLRQALGLLQSLLSMVGLCWTAPDYSTVCRRQKNLDVRVHFRATTQDLHMLADFTGIKFLGEGEWITKKHGAERRLQWRKVHLGIDAQTLQIRAIVVTTNEVCDSPMAADLLGQIPSHEKVASFTGDGAHDTQDEHEACWRRRAIPIIPPRKGVKLRKGLAFAHCNEAVKARRLLGCGIWKRWRGYHRTSLVVTKMNYLKRLGEKVMARTFER